MRVSTIHRGAWLGLALVLFPPAARADCDKCEDLCALVDQYLQRQKGIEIFKGYAASTAPAERRPLPPSAMSGDGVENLAFDEFAAWAGQRKWSGEMPCEPQGGGDSATEAVTNLGDCKIYWERPSAVNPAIFEKKTIETQQDVEDYEKAIGCKAIADATIEHERVHQRHCEAAHANRQQHLLASADFVAESELQAWSRQKDLLEQRIREILRNQGCGWDPTIRQKGDPHAVPSPAQMRKMERGWKAIKALSRRSPVK